MGYSVFVVSFFDYFLVFGAVRYIFFTYVRFLVILFCLSLFHIFFAAVLMYGE